MITSTDPVETVVYVREGRGVTRDLDHHLEYFFEISVDLLCIAGLDGYFKRVNPAFTKTLGYSRAELLEKPFIEFVHPDDQEATWREMGRLAEGVDTVYFENRYRCKDGGWRWLGWTCPAATPEYGLLYAVARDVTGQRVQREKLARLAYYDELTGLANRRAFGEATGRALSRARRSDGRVALLYVDVDGLKQVNDEKGHHAGDEVLRRFSAVVSACARGGDLVGRIGGDEIAVLLQGEDIQPGVLAGRLLEGLSEPFVVEKDTLQVTASIGISVSDGNDPVEQLIRRADVAMYHVKRAGGAGFKVFSPPH